MTDKNTLKAIPEDGHTHDKTDRSEASLDYLQNLEKSLVAISEASEILADKFVDDDDVKAGVSLIDPAIVKNRAAKKIFKRLFVTEYPEVAEAMEEVAAEVKGKL